MIEVLLHAMRHQAHGILEIELSAPNLPRFSPGAHIVLHLPNGLQRCYSLLPPTADKPCHYRIAVLNVQNGRGGSAFIHQTLRVGQKLSISEPRNNFPCDLHAKKNLLLAGGIGITPLYTMAKAFLTAGQDVKLIYCARNREHAAFLPEIESLYGLDLVLHFDDEQGRSPDLPGLLAGHDAETRFYACGPAAMLSSYQTVCAALGYPHAALELFLPPETPQSKAGAFNVTLNRSGKTIQVEAGQSILAALLQNNVDCDYSCREGLCGACETRVLSGAVDHADFVLMDSERAANTKMMICVSRSRDATLVLDL